MVNLTTMKYADFVGYVKLDMGHNYCLFRNTLVTNLMTINQV
jgi:hypothetical protein